MIYPKKLIKNRIKNVRKIMKLKKINILIISSPENIYYLSGLKIKNKKHNYTSKILIITKNKLLLLLKKYCINELQTNISLYNILYYKTKIAEKIKKILKYLNAKSIGFENTNLFKKLYSKHSTTFNNKIIIPANGIIETLRAKKSKQEISQIKKSLKISEIAFQKLLKIIKPGMTERKTAQIFEKIIQQLGINELSFPIIVASGPNSAIPHAEITNRKLREGEPIIFDWGIKLNGYCSDTSRTIILGTVNDFFLDVYKTVLNAQKKAISVMKAGIKTCDIDLAARKYIEKNKYFNKFIHGLGHGIGLEIHEIPKISQLEPKKLEPGMIVTIEPGIYISQWGGVRIEDQVLIKNNKCEILNKIKAFNYK